MWCDEFTVDLNGNSICCLSSWSSCWRLGWLLMYFSTVTGRRYIFALMLLYFIWCTREINGLLKLLFVCGQLLCLFHLTGDQDFPDDPTGNLAQFKDFIRSNFGICKWIGLTIVSIQVSLAHNFPLHSLSIPIAQHSIVFLVPLTS